MGTRRSRADIGSERGQYLNIELGREIRNARLDRGLSQEELGRATGLSRSEISRIERGLVRHVSIWNLARIFAVLGLELSARAYPSGEPIRDAGHVRLLARLQVHVNPSFEWRSEVPVTGGRDVRAWDAMLSREHLRIAIEAETRPRDLQAVERRVELKRVDSGVGRVVLLLADTRHNRALIREYAQALHANFPVAASVALMALARGDDPGGDAVIIL